MEQKTTAKRARRKYDEGFKTEALKMVESGRSVPQVAQALGIGENLLYKWRSQAKTTLSNLELSSQAELEGLRKQVRQLEQERDILKKALSIFSQKP
jgi:transposase